MSRIPCRTHVSGDVLREVPLPVLLLPPVLVVGGHPEVALAVRAPLARRGAVLDGQAAA